MLKSRKKLKSLIALILTFALSVTVFAPVASAEEAEPSIPDLSSTLCLTIDGFSPDTKVNQLISNTALSETESLTVYDKDGFPLSSSDYVTNSSVIVITNNGVVSEAYKVRLYGDLDYDGRINSFDITEIKFHLAGSLIDDEIAADINADGIVNTTDLSTMKLFYAGAATIKQNRQHAYVSRFNWLNTSAVDFKISGYQEIFEDFSVLSNDIDLTFNRYYDSNNTSAGILGTGWTLSFEGSCKTYGENGKIITIYGQTPIVFEYSNGAYSCKYSRSTLTSTNNGFVYVGEDRLTYTFNANGYLVSVSDSNNNMVSINVDANGKIQKVTDSVGRIYSYTYNDNGYLSSITDPAGRTVSFSYNISGRLLSVTGVLGTVTERYSYNSNNKITAVSDAFENYITQITYEENSGVVTSVTDVDGVTVNYSYNPDFNSITLSQSGEVIEQYIYNRYNYLSLHSPGDGVQTNYFLNEYGDTVLSENSDGSSTKYTYNAKGNALTVATTTEEETTTETNTYDSSGNLLTTTSDGEKYTYTYDGITGWYDTISNGFSVEAYVYLDKKPSSGFMDFVANLNSAGFGLAYKNDGKIYFYCHVGGAYVTPSYSFAVGQWVHIVGTFDGTNVKLYVNGQLVATKAASGTMKAPTIASSCLGIGADMGKHNEARESYFQGKIATVNIYSAELSDAQIAKLYQAYQE